MIEGLKRRWALNYIGFCKSGRSIFNIAHRAEPIIELGPERHGQRTVHEKMGDRRSVLGQNGQVGELTFFILYRRLFVQTILCITLYWNIGSFTSLVTWKGSEYTLRRSDGTKPYSVIFCLPLVVGDFCAWSTSGILFYMWGCQWKAGRQSVSTFLLLKAFSTVGVLLITNRNTEESCSVDEISAGRSERKENIFFLFVY